MYKAKNKFLISQFPCIYHFTVSHEGLLIANLGSGIQQIIYFFDPLTSDYKRSLVQPPALKSIYL